jgi:hypothetical protein
LQQSFPGEQLSTLPEDPGRAQSFTHLSPGAYSVDVYAINWSDAPDWYADARQPVPESAPADVVLRFSRREGMFIAPTAKPRIFVELNQGWLFPVTIYFTDQRD